MLRTGQLAKAAGVNIQTIRYYERLGFWTPPARSLSGYRAYPPETVKLIAQIKDAQSLGFTLHEIRSVLLGAGGLNERAAHSLLTERIRQIDVELADLQRRRDRLVALKEACRCGDVCGFFGAGQSREALVPLRSKPRPLHRTG